MFSSPKASYFVCFILKCQTLEGHEITVEQGRRERVEEDSAKSGVDRETYNAHALKLTQLLEDGART